MVLAIVSVFCFCALRAQKQNTKRRYSTAVPKAKIAYRVSRRSNDCVSSENSDMAEQAPTIESARRRARPETSAWLMLITFFLIFCAIVAGAGLIGWNYYAGAME